MPDPPSGRRELLAVEEVATAEGVAAGKQYDRNFGRYMFQYPPAD